MKLKDEVCDFKSARRLCELGEKQEGLWWWMKVNKEDDWSLVSSEELNSTIDIETTLNTRKRIKYYSAPTVAELGERLGFHRPYQLKCEPDYGKGKNWDSKGAHWTGGFKKIKWFMDIDKEKMIELGEITEAIARAKMRIYLLEDKLKEGEMNKIMTMKGEISGFGCEYEEACRLMLVAGLEWFKKHPKANPKFHGWKNIYGIIQEDNADAKSLSEAIVSGAPDRDCTGAMHQAVVSACLWIRKNGIKKYLNKMNK